MRIFFLRTVVRIGSLLLLAHLLGSAPLSAQETRGRDFWGGYMYNINSGGKLAEILVYVIARVNTTGTVTMPRTGWSTNFTVTANTGTLIKLPEALMMSFGSEGVENKGFRITTADSVEVYTYNYLPQNADGSILLPVDALGSDYRVVNYTGSPPESGPQPTEFQIIAVEDGTNIEITPTGTTAAGNLPGVPYMVMMQAGQVFQVQSETELTGTRVRSLNGRRFALQAGGVRTWIPVGVLHRDAIYEQLYPTDKWGTYFVTTPLIGRKGDTYRIVTATDSTVVSIDGSPRFTFNAGEFREFVLDSPSVINASAPIEVAQFANGSDFDFGLGDPAMWILNPVDFVRHDLIFYGLPKANLRKHYVNIVTISSALNQVQLDGVPIAASFSPVPADSFYSYARIEVTPGDHRLTSYWGVNAYVYGFGVEEGIMYSTGSDNLRSCRSPAISALGDTVFCLGDSVTLDAGSGYLAYLWSNGDTLRRTTIKAAGQYSVATIDSNGCQRPSRPVRVTVHQPPQAAITLSPGDTICPCDSAVLSAPAGLRYRWSTGDTTQEIVTHAAGTFDVVVTNAFGCTNAATASVAVEDLMPIVAIGNVEGRPGDVVRVPVYLANAGIAGRCGARDFTITLGYNSTLLRVSRLDGGVVAVTDNHSDSGRQVTTIAGTRAGDTLVVIEFEVGLGNAERSGISIDAFRWENCAAIRSDTVNGSFGLVGICYEGGPRLLDPVENAGLKTVRPNPTRGNASIGFTLSEEGPTELTITDLLGKHVRTVVHGVMKPGRYDVDLDASGFAAGTYMIVLATPSERFTMPLAVRR